MNEAHAIAHTLHIPGRQVAATIRLLDEGNTVPFIARYRKEITGGLTDEQVQDVATQLGRVRALNDRRQVILKRLEELGALTPELKERVDSADSLTLLEDLYAPHRPRRQTRAAKAREAGLEPLATLIVRQPVSQGFDSAEIAARFLTPNTPTVAHVWTGARDIVAEMIADHPDVRQTLRHRAWDHGTLRVSKIDGAADPQQVYKLYYDFSAVVQNLRPHQVLAVNRGEKENVLRVGLTIPEHDVLLAVRRGFKPHPRSPLKDQLEQATDDALKRLLLPAIERDIRRQLTEKAEAHAIDIFGKNLQALLSQPPLTGRTILAIDPAFRTGCKVAVIDPTGKVLMTATVYPHQPQRQRDDALKLLLLAVQRHDVSVIAVGNGTASRETEQLVAELTRNLDNVRYLIVDESGASVYSASAIARDELPDLDVSLRGAVSIARRVQDPLAELVKIDPKSIGVGMYQHDVNQNALGETLDNVVGLMVNRVGVDVNTASPALLTHVAGIGPRLAERIVAHREANGPFASRRRLQDVSGLGPKAFEQAAGFLRIRDGDNPLDRSAIHPESYAAADQLMVVAAVDLTQPPDVIRARLDALLAETAPTALAARLGIGEPTLHDIAAQLVAPGRDPRADLPPPLLRKDVLSVEDLTPGLRLHGTVRNVVDFGAFVDIGVKRDGLLHRTQIPRGAEIQVGQVLEVEIRSVDLGRGRIDLGWPST